MQSSPTHTTLYLCWLIAITIQCRSYFTPFPWCPSTCCLSVARICRYIATRPQWNLEHDRHVLTYDVTESSLPHISSSNFTLFFIPSFFLSFFLYFSSCSICQEAVLHAPGGGARQSRRGEIVRYIMTLRSIQQYLNSLSTVPADASFVDIRLNIKLPRDSSSWFTSIHVRRRIRTRLFFFFFFPPYDGYKGRSAGKAMNIADIS